MLYVTIDGVIRYHSDPECGSYRNSATKTSTQELKLPKTYLIYSIEFSASTTFAVQNSQVRRHGYLGIQVTTNYLVHTIKIPPSKGFSKGNDGFGRGDLFVP